LRVRGGFSPEEAEKILQRGGKLSLSEVIHCHLRYVSDGVVLGSREFVDEFFESRRQMFSPARTSGARRMKGADWEGLMSLRDLGSGAVRV
jgi:hypothetical protein